MDTAVHDLLASLGCQGSATALANANARTLNDVALLVTDDALFVTTVPSAPLLTPLDRHKLLGRLYTRGHLVRALQSLATENWLGPLCDRFPSEPSLQFMTWRTLRGCIDSLGDGATAGTSAIMALWAKAVPIRGELLRRGIDPLAADRLVEQSVTSVDALEKYHVDELVKLWPQYKVKLLQLWAASAAGKREAEEQGKKDQQRRENTEHANKSVQEMRSRMSAMQLEQQGQPRALGLPSLHPRSHVDHPSAGHQQALPPAPPAFNYGPPPPVAPPAVPHFPMAPSAMPSPPFAPAAAPFATPAAPFPPAPAFSTAGDALHAEFHTKNAHRAAADESTQLVLKASAGRVLFGIQIGLQGDEIAVLPPCQLLAPPASSIKLLGPSMGDTEKTTVLRTTSEIKTYEGAIKSGGTTLALAFSAGGWGVSVDASAQVSTSDARDEMTSQTRNTMFLASCFHLSVTTHAFVLAKADVILAPDAVNELARVADKTQALAFLRKFGSHVHCDKQHLGGTVARFYEVRSVSSVSEHVLKTELSKKRSASLALAAKAWGVSATGGASASEESKENHENSSKQSDSEYSFEQSTVLFGPAAHDLASLRKTLREGHNPDRVGDETLWHLIDRGSHTGLVPVWKFARASLGDRDHAEFVARLLRHVWLEEATKLPRNDVLSYLIKDQVDELSFSQLLAHRRFSFHRLDPLFFLAPIRLAGTVRSQPPWHQRSCVAFPQLHLHYGGPFAIDTWFCLLPGTSETHEGGVLLGAQSPGASDAPQCHRQLIHVDAHRNLYCSVVGAKRALARLDARRWYHVALTYDGERQQRVYLDGVLVSSDAGPLHHSLLATELVTQVGTGWISDLSVGKPTVNFAGWYGFYGDVWDLRVWRTPLAAKETLTVDEIARLASGQRPDRFSDSLQSNVLPRLSGGACFRRETAASASGSGEFHLNTAVEMMAAKPV